MLIVFKESRPKIRPGSGDVMERSRTSERDHSTAGIEYLEDIQFEKIEYKDLDEFVTSSNWKKYRSFLFCEQQSSALKKLIKESDKILSDIKIVERAKYIQRTSGVEKEIIDKLPKLVESQFSKSAYVRKEKITRNLNAPKSSILEYNDVNWLEYLSLEFANPMAEAIKTTVLNRDKWIQENYTPLGYPKSLEGLDPVKLVIYKVINLASQTFRTAKGADWRSNVRFLNYIYFSSSTQSQLKPILKSEGFILDTENIEECDWDIKFDELTHKLRMRLKSYEKYFS